MPNNARDSLQEAYPGDWIGWVLNEHGEPTRGEPQPLGDSKHIPVTAEEDEYANKKIRDLEADVIFETRINRRLQASLRKIRDEVEIAYYDSSVKKKFVLGRIIEILDGE